MNKYIIRSRIDNDFRIDKDIDLSKIKRYSEILQQLNSPQEIDTREIGLLRKEKCSYEIVNIELYDFFKLRASKKTTKSQEFFESGDFNALEAHLNKESTSLSLLHPSELLYLQAQLRRLDYRKKNRLQECTDLFSKALQLKESWNIRYEFSRFLQDHDKFNQALAHYHLLLKSPPRDYEAKLNYDIACLHFYKSQYPLAQKHFTIALELSLNQSFIAKVQNYIGLCATIQNQDQKALKAFEAAAVTREQLLLVSPYKYAADYAESLDNLGLFYYEQNQWSQAKAYFLKGLKIHEQYLNTHPQDFRAERSILLNNLGNLHEAQNQFDQAEEYLQQALQLRRILALENPRDYLPHLGGTLYAFANALYWQNKPIEALVLASESRDIRSKLFQKDPQAFSSDLALSLNALGNIYSSLEQKEKAIIEYRQALLLFEALQAQDKQSYQSKAAATHNNLGLLYQSLQLLEEAALQFRTALEIREELYKENAQRFGKDLAESLVAIGDFYTHQNVLQLAIEQYQAALKHYQTEDSLSHRALCYHKVAHCLRLQEADEQAYHSYQHSITLYAQLLERDYKRYVLEWCIIKIEFAHFLTEINYKDLALQELYPAFKHLQTAEEHPQKDSYLQLAIQLLDFWQQSE